MVLLGGALKPGRGVHCVPKKREFAAVRTANLAHHHFPVVHPNADFHLDPGGIGFPARVEFLKRWPHRKGGADCQQRILFRGKGMGVAPGCHDGVPDEFLEGAAVSQNEPDHPVEVLVELAHQGHGVAGFED